jgi:hypothetical protein
MEIVLAKEMKRITEDMQLRDTKVKKIIQSFFYFKCLYDLATSNIKTG